jgi:hypothetical protein
VAFGLRPRLQLLLGRLSSENRDPAHRRELPMRSQITSRSWLLARRTPNVSQQLCAQAACSEVTEIATHRSGIVQFPSGRLSLFAQQPERWTVAVLEGKRPAEVTAKLYAKSALIATRRVALDRRRGDPSDTCHNWQTTGPVKIQVP